MVEEEEKAGSIAGYIMFHSNTASKKLVMLKSQNIEIKPTQYQN